MQRWHIHGADAKSGQDRFVSVRADDEAEVRHIAKQMGLMVLSIQAVIPAYNSLNFGAGAFRVIGAMWFVITLARIVLLFVSLARSTSPANVGSGLYEIAGAITATLLAFAIAGALDALRDVARNSFRT